MGSFLRRSFIKRRIVSFVTFGLGLGVLGVFLAPTTSAVGSSISFTSLTLSSQAPGAASTYTLVFSPSAAGALTAGTSTIVMSGAFGTEFSANPAAYSVNGTVASAVTISQGGETATLVTPVSVSALTSTTLIATNVRNPEISGSYMLSLSTSADTAPIGSSSLIGTQVSFSSPPTISNQGVAASGVGYTIGFKTSPQGGLSFGSTIQVNFPTSTTLPTLAGAYFVNGVAAQSVSPSGSSVTISIPEPQIPPNCLVMVGVAGVTNPTTSGTDTISVSTASDSLPANTPPFQIGTQVSAPALSLSTTALGATGVVWSATFLTSSAGALTSGTSTISIGVPPGNTLPAAASSYVVNGVTASTVSVSGQAATVTSPVSVGTSTSVTLSMTGVTNANTLGLLVAYAWTSSDLAPSPMNFALQTAVGSLAASVDVPVASTSAAPQLGNFTFSFTPLNPVPAGSGTISLCAPPAYVLPGAGTLYSIRQQSSMVAFTLNPTTASCPSGFSGVTFFVPTTLGNGGGIIPGVPVTITVAGMPNPLTAGSFVFAIATSSDGGYAFTPPVTISAAPANEVIQPSMSVGVLTTGSADTLNGSFTTPVTLTAGTDTITVTMPPSTTLPNNPADYAVNATPVTVASVSISGGTTDNQVTMTIPAGATGLTAGSLIAFSLGVATSAFNPTVAGNYTAQVSTSLDTTPASTEGFVFYTGSASTTAVSSPGLVVTPPDISSSTNNIYFTGTTSSTGAINGLPGSPESITLSSNLTSASSPFPSTASDYVVNGIQLSSGPALSGTTGAWLATFGVPIGLSVGNGSPLAIDVAGFLNNSITGSFKFGVDTTADGNNGSPVLATLVLSSPPSSVSSVSGPNPTPLIAGASNAQYSISFTSTSGLGTGNWIRVQLAPGTQLPTTTSSYAVTDTTTSTSCPVSSASGGYSDMITLGSCTISSGNSVSVVISGVINPIIPSTSYYWSVSTQTDGATVAGASYVIGSGVMPLAGLAPDPTTIGAISTYTVGFITSPFGALSAGSSTVTVSAPTGTLFPSTVSDYVVNGVGASTVTGGGSNLVSITVPVNAPPGGTVIISITGVTNPFTANPAESWSMWTSADSGTVFGGLYPITTAVTSTSSSITSNVAGAPGDTFTVGFTATSALTAGSDSISLSYPPGTTSATLASDYTVNGTSATSVVISGQHVTITTPVSIAASGSVTLVVSNVGNPVQPGTYTVEVWTSKDMTQVPAGSPLTFVLPPTPTVTSVSPPTSSTNGGESVTVTGTGFTTDSIVYFGQYPAGSVTVVSSTSLVAVTPSDPAGAIDTTVTTLGGTSATSSADQVTFVSPPPPPTTVTNITLSPSASSLAPGSSVTFTATVTTSSTQSGTTTTTPVSGSSVSFDISSGPDTGQTSSATTNSNGIATYTYKNNGTSGSDVVTAGISGVIASSIVTFTGQYSITLTPASQSAVVGVAAPLSATVLDPLGNPVAGVSVTVSVTSGPDTGQTNTGSTDTSGTVSLLLNGIKAGTDNLTATFQTPSSPSSPATTITSNGAVVKWAAPVNISTSSSTPTGANGTPSNPAPPGSSVRLTVLLTEPAAAAIARDERASSTAPLGHVSSNSSSRLTVIPSDAKTLTSFSTSGTLPLVGVSVTFSVTSGPDSGQGSTVATDSTGTASWSDSNSGTPGTDNVVASFADSAGISHSTTFSVDFSPLAITTTTSGTTTTIATTTTTIPVATTTVTTLPPAPGATTVPPASSGGSSYCCSSPPTSVGSGGSATTTATTSPTTTVASSGTHNTTKSSSSTTLSPLSHLKRGSSSGGSASALGPISTTGSGQLVVDGVTNNSNGNNVPPDAVRVLVKAGQTGPAMPYSTGYGLGKGGGPPGPAGLSRSIPTASVAFHNIGKTAKSNAGLAVLLLFLVGLPAMIFNSALREHESKIVANVGPIRRAFKAAEAKLESIHGATLLIGFALVGSLLYALDDPAFGLNLGSLAEVVGFALAIIISTIVTEILRGVYVHRRFQKVGDLRAFPLGIGIALIFDLFSRLSHFEPGYVFGIMAAVIFRVKPTGEEDGRSTTYAYIWLFLAGVVAWLIYGPVNSAVVAGDHHFWLLVAEAMLSYVWICGLQALFFSLIPARYMDGEIIFRWSKIVWATIYLIVTFIFVQFVLHPTAAGYGGNRNTSLVPMIAIFIASSVAAGIFWIYSHVKYGRVTPSEVPESVGEL